MKVRWAASALEDLRQVNEYLNGENTGAATQVRRRILDTGRRIGQMSFSGRIGRVDGTREAVVTRTPFIVVYQVRSLTLDILAIMHGAQRWPEAF